MTHKDSGDSRVDGFASLKVQPRKFLDEIQGRSLCSKCNKSRKFYCYTCYQLVGEVKHKLRTVKLPIKVDIIKHPNEVDGKSTAPHARVISPDFVTIHTYPCIPDYDREKVILVFPGADSVSLDQLKECNFNKDSETPESHIDSIAVSNLHVVHQDTQPELGETKSTKSTNVHRGSTVMSEDTHTSSVCEQNLKRKPSSLLQVDCAESKPKAAKYDDLSTAFGSDVVNSVNEQWRCRPSFDRVVFIDSTWLQSKKIFNDERLKGLRKVELNTRLTKFWRPQGNHPDTYLATIEAIYYFFKDFHEIFISSDYDGQYDNLLFFFLYTYEKVQSSRDSKKTCKR